MTTPVAPTSKDSNGKGQNRKPINFQAFGIYAAVVVLVTVLSLLSPVFLSVGNLRDVAISASVNAIIGLGLTFVIITGGIDLAVGAMASLVGIVSGTLMVNLGFSPIASLLIGLFVGIFAGVVNGLLVTKLKLPPFIATLGTMSIFQGLAFVVCDGKPVYNVPKDFILLLNSYVLGIPFILIIVAIVGVISWVLLRKTVFGENVIAVGGSEETAWLSGIRVHRVKISVYAISGLLSALAGMIIVARINAGQPTAGGPYQLTAIAAAVIGGANLMGGEGRIGGTLIGAFILAALSNGLVLLNVPSFYEQIVTGFVVLFAVALDQGSKGWPMLRSGKSKKAALASAAESK